GRAVPPRRVASCKARIIASVGNAAPCSSVGGPTSTAGSRGTGPPSTPRCALTVPSTARSYESGRRRPDCPCIFHGKKCGTPRYDKKGNRKPCLGDFQKVWDRACTAIGMSGRIPHDRRRSGVKHYIDAGVDPHTVMQWSWHRTMAMLVRYHIIDLEDLRRAGKRASDYRGPVSNVVPLGARTVAKPTTAEPLHETETPTRVRARS